MSIDHNRLAGLVDDVERSLKRLEQLAQMPAGDFVDDEDAQDIARSRLLIAIEAVISICFHVCAKHLNRVPAEYAQCFSLLEEAKVIDSALAARLKNVARFRNRLIHVYWDTDFAQVHGILREDLNDLRDFVRAIGDLERSA